MRKERIQISLSYYDYEVLYALCEKYGLSKSRMISHLIMAASFGLSQDLVDNIYNTANDENEVFYE